jgi:hypothetical protein
MRLLLLIISLVSQVPLAMSAALTLNPIAVATSLNFSEGAVNLKVADIRLDWDSTAGSAVNYNVSISSQNSGFKHLQGLGSVITYSLTYKGTNKTVINTSQLYYSFTVPSSSPDGNNVDALYLTFTGISFASLYSGFYEDTLTVTYESL